MSITDRELLELAAKAAGFKDATWAAEQACIATLEQKRGFKLFWNPIEDDGDALRLAVKLRIQITPGTYNKDEFSAFKAAGGEAHEFRHYQQDEFAATRRAIVCAAAEIGRAMP